MAQGIGVSAPLPDGWRGAEVLGANPDQLELEWRQVFAAATYDPTSIADGRGCMGGGPVLDAMPAGDAYVEVLERRDLTAKGVAALPPRPVRFDYAAADPALHECFGKSFEFGPFASAGRALLARVFIRVDPGTGMSNGLVPTRRADRARAIEVLDGLKVAERT